MSKSVAVAAESSIIPPTQERMQHDPIGPYKARSFDKDGKPIVVETIQDSNGSIGSPFSVCDTIPLLRLRKAINDAHVKAAFAYMDDFDTAKMEQLRSAPLEILGKGQDGISDAVIRARERLWQARRALDLGTTIERAAWAVLGQRWNLKEWTEREGFIFSEQTAKRLLIAALIGLAEHYGFERRK